MTTNDPTSSALSPPMNDWLKLILTSPLAAALSTALIGAFLTNYMVDVFKNKTALAERKLQRQADLAARQFETIQKLIDFESEYYVAAEFAFFNLIERRDEIAPSVFGSIASDYDSAAKSFITNGRKAYFASEVYLKGDSALTYRRAAAPASSPQEIVSIQEIFESIVKTEGKIAEFVCKNDKIAAEFSDEARKEGKELRETLRDQHNEFVTCLSKVGAAVYHPQAN